MLIASVARRGALSQTDGLVMDSSNQLKEQKQKGSAFEAQKRRMVPRHDPFFRFRTQSATCDNKMPVTMQKKIEILALANAIAR